MAGVARWLSILVGVQLRSPRPPRQRVDLTAEHAYTLSQGTRNILAKLDTPVQIRFYCHARRRTGSPVILKTYASSVEDLLDEYRQASKGKIESRSSTPTPDSDAEDSAKLDGVEGQMLPTARRFISV